MKYFLRLSTLLLGIALGASAVFLYQHLGTMHPAERIAAPQIVQLTNSSITEISRERTGSWGVRYGYKIVLRADGTANYFGEQYSERPGKFKGNVSQCDFKRIVELMETRGYFGSKDTYHGGCSDSEASSISAIRDDVRKTVSVSGMCYGSNAEKFKKMPQVIWNLETAIDGVAASVDWQPDK